MTTYKTCTKCKDPKPLERFYFIKRSNSYDGRCKDCVKDYMKGRRENVPGVAEKEAESQRKSYNARKVRDPTIGTWATLTKRQKADRYQAVKEWRNRNWTRFNKEARQSIQLRRSLACRKAWPFIVAHYGGKCLNCGTAKALCFDHVKPLKDNGPNLITNGQPLCKRCNTFKGATVGNKDHRPDKGAWIAELGRLNPWLVEPMPEGRWHLREGGKERLMRLTAESERELVMPGHIAQEDERGSGFQPCATDTWPLRVGQIAQQRLLDTLLANLPH